MRKQLVMSLVLLLAAGLPMLLVAPQEAAAHACACLDGNGDDLCGNAADTPIDDAQWLNGPVSFPGQTFVVPGGCDHVKTTAPAGGISVTAQRIVFDGQLRSTPSGGEGVLFTATDACVVSPGAFIESGGINKLSPVVAGNEAIAKSSIGFKCGTTCDINGTLQNTASTLFASGKVGIQCGEDVTLCGVRIQAAGVNIQSLNGEIDASVGGGGGVAGIACDDPVKNLVNGGAPPGDGDSVLENTADDFPCQIQFNNIGDITAFCAPVGECGPSQIEALNNPLIMISKLDLNLAGQPGNENLLRGVFRVTLAAEDGDIDTSDANVTNEKITGGFIAGGKIWVFADPTSINRLPVDKEDFLGPSSGTTDINSACYTSPNPVQHGDAGAPIVGAPDAPPCRQIGDFVPVLNGIF